MKPVRQLSPRREWLTLEQASERLGIHPTTLRRWVDEGSIDAFLTPGGHRRFLVSDLERFEHEHHRCRTHEKGESGWSEHALAHTRLEIPNQQWVTSYEESERETQRNLGRRLIGLTLQYVGARGDNPELLAEARAIGMEHGRHGVRRGQPLMELLQAVSFFRTNLLESALVQNGLPRGGRPEENTRLLRRIEGLLGAVQAGVVEIYQPGVASSPALAETNPDGGRC